MYIHLLMCIVLLTVCRPSVILNIKHRVREVKLTNNWEKKDLSQWGLFWHTTCLAYQINGHNVHRHLRKDKCCRNNSRRKNSRNTETLRLWLQKFICVSYVVYFSCFIGKPLGHLVTLLAKHQVYAQIIVILSLFTAISERDCLTRLQWTEGVGLTCCKLFLPEVTLVHANQHKNGSVLVSVILQINEM
jgi:hypothetical protein